ncbi:hypothetical protein Taro_017724 [Colocasia esculenta]|uniref:SCP domain-containing protein n=1 Tax=Colocasia esculenta TaxID=4460 RepID=A0A843UU49_COLES|nr:hypothetical protein [Colocasia esculenta]
MAASSISTTSSLRFLSACLLILFCPSSFTLAAGTSSSTDRSAITAAQFLAGHNAARQVVGVPPLQWDKQLTKYARVYANQRRRDCNLVHSPGYAFGENIFWGMGHRWRRRVPYKQQGNAEPRSEVLKADMRTKIHGLGLGQLFGRHELVGFPTQNRTGLLKRLVLEVFI